MNPIGKIIFLFQIFLFIENNCLKKKNSLCNLKIMTYDYQI